MNILGPTLHRRADCEAVLRTLAPWFGIETALMRYAADTETWPTFAHEHDGRLVSFLSLKPHFPQAWEVHCMAVRAEFRGQGLGSALLDHAQGWLAGQGVRFLQVKTVAPASDSVAYAATRRFYLARDFTPLEVFPTLWDPRNPALQLVKVLEAS